MADSWDATVTAVDVLPTYPATPVTGTAFIADNNTLIYGLVAHDKANPGRYLFIRITLKTNATGAGWETHEAHGHSTSSSMGPLGVTDTFTTTGAEATFAGGGTVTITKNETANQYEFDGLLGTSNIPFATFGATADGELEPTELEVFAGTVNEVTGFVFAGTDATELRVRFEDFFGKHNGTNIKGATLASGDRGEWTTAGGALDPFIFSASAGNTGTQSDDDSASAIGIHLEATPVAPTLGQEFAFASATWDTGIYIDSADFNPYRLAVDAVLCPMSGALYALRVADSEPEEVFFAVSRDRGVTWEEQTLDMVGGAQMVWPTLSVDARGRILALWQDRNEPTRQYWAISETYGKTWSAVQSAAQTEFSTIRARFDPMNGFLYYVYRDVTAGQLKVIAHDEVALAGFVPADPWTTPRTVINAASDHWPALTFSDRGFVQLQWAEMQRVFAISDSLGVDWDTSSSETMTTKEQPAVWKDPASRLHYLVTQDPTSGDVTSFISEDGGLTALTGPGGTVIAGIEQQYPAVVTDDRGIVYVLYQELDGSSYVLRCRRSDSLGQTWVTP